MEILKRKQKWNGSVHWPRRTVKAMKLRVREKNRSFQFFDFFLYLLIFAFFFFSLKKLHYADHSNVPQYEQVPVAAPESYHVKNVEARSAPKNSPYSARQSSTLIYSSNKGPRKFNLHNYAASTNTPPPPSKGTWTRRRINFIISIVKLFRIICYSQLGLSELRVSL